MDKISVKNLLEAFPDELKLVSGNAEAQVIGPCSQNQPQKQHIVFINKPESAAEALKAQVACIVIPREAEALAADLKTEIAIVSAENTKLMMAKVNQSFFPVQNKLAAFSDDKIHPSAVVHSSAQIHESVEVGPKAVIAAGVTIGKNSKIGAGCVIEKGATLGEFCLLHPNTVICYDVVLGNHVEIKANSTMGGEGFGYAQDKDLQHHKIPHYGTLIIEDYVHIGANVSYDRGTFENSKIGRNTRIDNHCHFAHNVEIGENTLITAGLIVAGSTKIGSNNIFAGRVSINGHINIGDNMIFGPMSAITNDIDKPGMYGGFPVIPYKQYLKVQASLSSLPQMRKDIAKAIKKLGLNE